MPTGNPDRLLYYQTKPELGDRSHALVAFKSPGGDTHRVALFHNAAAPGRVRTSAEAASDQDTYFPGYHWRPVTCSRCQRHLGWLFEDIKSDGKAQGQGNAHVHRETTIFEADASEVLSVGQKREPLAVPGPPTHRLVRFTEEVHRELVQTLDGSCLRLPLGWWTVELCHGRHVRQLHFDSSGKLEVDFSLGTYRADARIERISKEYRHFTSHFYDGGQWCDETQSDRRTEVAYYCCPDKMGIVQGPIIESFGEPKLCSYRIRVCVPALCVERTTGIRGRVHPKEPDDTSSARDLSPTDEDTDDDQPEQPPRVRHQREKTTKDAIATGSHTTRFFAALWDAVVGDCGEDLAWAWELPLATVPK
jgi:hypothetical protein